MLEKVNLLLWMKHGNITHCQGNHGGGKVIIPALGEAVRKLELLVRNYIKEVCYSTADETLGSLQVGVKK